MPELVGSQTTVILDPYDMTFDSVGVFGLDFQLLFKSGSSYCVMYLFGLRPFRFAFANSYEIISYKCCCPEKLNAINSFYSVFTKLTQFSEYKLCLSFF